jgi:hypothetical protein
MKPIDHTQTFTRDPARAIARAALTRAICQIDRSMKPEEYAAQRWKFDDDVSLILRAATTPADMTNTAALVQVVAAVLPMLYPQSAAARLFELCPKVTLGPQSGGVTVPGCGVVPVAFVAEGAAKPVVQGAVTAARLDPHKIAGITVASSELFSLPDAETFMRTMLAESAGPVLDAAVFSTAAASAAVPAGLLNGIAGLTPDAGTGAKSDAMVADLKTLSAAIAPVAGAGPIIFVVNVAQEIAFSYRALRENPGITILRGAIAAGTVIAIAGNAVVSAIGVPEFETSTNATLSMNDTATAWPNPPVSSMWQTVSIAIKMILNASWGRRATNGVAYMTSVNW